MNPAFTEKWFLRCQDLVDKYHPDVVYFDNTELPLGQAGLDIVAHYYNSNLARNKGQLEAVVNAKHMKPDHIAALVDDIERGVATYIRDGKRMGQNGKTSIFLQWLQLSKREILTFVGSPIRNAGARSLGIC